MLSDFLIIKYHDENHSSVYNHLSVNFCGFDEKLCEESLRENAFELKSLHSEKLVNEKNLPSPIKVQCKLPHCKVKKVDHSNGWQLSLVNKSLATEINLTKLKSQDKNLQNDNKVYKNTDYCLQKSVVNEKNKFSVFVCEKDQNIMQKSLQLACEF